MTRPGRTRSRKGCPTPEKAALRTELDAKLWALRQVNKYEYRGEPYECACRRWHVRTEAKRRRA